MFSRSDANSEFHQLLLEENSQKHTTFIAPFGRYCYCRLPFGISFAPEHFQRRMSNLPEGLDGIICLMDNILLFGSTQKEHDIRFTATQRRLEQAGVTLNESKCQFSQKEIGFCGHVIDGIGIHQTLTKFMPSRRCQHAKCGRRSEIFRYGQSAWPISPRLASLTHVLRSLLSKGNAWVWGLQQQQAFQNCKKELSSLSVLAPYNVNFKTRIFADAPSFGLSAVICQRQPSGAPSPINHEP